MNEFTKEELNHIADALYYSTVILPERVDDFMPIRGKILEMIEVYRKHKPYMDVTLSDGTRVQCTGLILAGGAGGGGGCGNE